MSSFDKKSGMFNLAQVIEIGIREALKDTHTMLPGVIDEFDAATQLAKITPVNAVQFTDNTILEAPPFINVPIQFMRFGGFALTMPVKTGDAVAVFFSERSMDNYLTTGKIGEPPRESRYFDLSDSFAIPGLYPQTNVIPDFNSSDLEIRSDDGTKKVTFQEDGTFLVSAGNMSFELRPSGKVKIENSQGEVISVIDDILTELIGATVLVGTGSSAGSWPFAPTVIANLTLLKTLIGSFKI